MWNPGTCDYECNKMYKIEEYLDVKNCSCKRCLCKLVLAFEDKILNIIEASLIDKKVTCTQIIALVTIFLWQLYAYYY